MRGSGAFFRAIVTLAFLLAVVVSTLGAYVRLSNAGLSCPDWPAATAGSAFQDRPTPWMRRRTFPIGPWTAPGPGRRWRIAMRRDCWA